MKTYNRYITLAAMALTFAACSQDEDFLPQETDSDAVRINATIGILPQTRLAYGAKDANNQEATTFENGDQIRVINHTRTEAGKGKSDAVYKLDDWDSNETTDAAWEPATATNYVVWNGTGSNTIYGVYPADAEYTTFTIPTDQSSTAEGNKITAADWMTASYIGTQPGYHYTFSLTVGKEAVEISTVNVTEWNFKDVQGGVAELVGDNN